MHTHNSVTALRTAIPYIRAYKGRVFVVKLGGRLCEPGPTLDNIVEQLSLLYQVGIRIVVVHGGGDQLNALSERLGCKPNIVAGRRVTDDETLELAKMVFAGSVNTDIIAAFRGHGVSAIGMTGVDAGVVTVVKRPVRSVTDPSTGKTQDVDFGHVGDVTHVAADPLRHQLAGGLVPVIGSLAADEAGNVYNVNADTLASRIATALGAAKYFLLTTVDGVLRDVRDPSTLCSWLDIAQLQNLIDSGVIAGGMLPKLAACVDALKGGVSRVHIVNGTQPDTLLSEIFTNEGCGTLIVSQRDNAKQAADAPTGGS